MDFGKFNGREIAEQGVPLRLVHPETGEPIGTDKNPALVILRGSSSKTAQENMRKAVRAAKAGRGDKEAVAECMEDLLKIQIDQALAFIVGFENVTMGGTDPTGDEALTRDLLSRFLPEMDVKRDDKGVPIVNDKGGPEVEIRNHTFPAQIIKFVEDKANFAGNA